MSVLLEVRNLKKYFPVNDGILSREKRFVKAVDDVSFTVDRGETIGIVGESGCGKSTLGQTILQLQPATSGQILYNGTDLCALTEREMKKYRKDLQIIFQDPYSSINPRKNIETIVTEPMIVHHLIKPSEKKEHAIELLKKVGLGEQHLRRMPHEFSGGQRQRIGIARALGLNPKLIVCDEPVSALDVSIQAQVLNLLKSLQEEYGLTYLFIAHGVPVVRHISDRIAVMYLGKIVEFSGRDELFSGVAHPYTQALLSAVPTPDPDAERNRILLPGEIPSPINPPAGCRFHTRCPYAKEICKSVEPELKSIGTNHLCACHFPLSSTASDVGAVTE